MIYRNVYFKAEGLRFVIPFENVLIYVYSYDEVKRVIDSHLEELK